MPVAGRLLACALALALLLLAPAGAFCRGAGLMHGFFAGDAPFSRISDDGGPEGLCSALLVSLAGAGKLEVRHLPLRPEAAQDFLRAGIIDLYFAFVEAGSSPPGGLAFGSAVLESPLAAVSRDGALAGAGLVASPMPVGVVAGSWEEKALSAMRARLGGQCRMRPYPSREALARALSQGEIASALVPACTAGILQEAAPGAVSSGPLQDWGRGRLVPVFRADDDTGRRRFDGLLDRFRRSGGLDQLLRRWVLLEPPGQPGAAGTSQRAPAGSVGGKA